MLWESVRLGCAPQALAGSTNIVSTRNLDNELISGDYISVINGVRISTPFFGTAYNFCIGARMRCQRLAWRMCMNSCCR